MNCKSYPDFLSIKNNPQDDALLLYCARYAHQHPQALRGKLAVALDRFMKQNLPTTYTSADLKGRIRAYSKEDLKKDVDSVVYSRIAPDRNITKEPLKRKREEKQSQPPAPIYRMVTPSVPCDESEKEIDRPLWRSLSEDTNLSDVLPRAVSQVFENELPDL